MFLIYHNIRFVLNISFCMLKGLNKNQTKKFKYEKNTKYSIFIVCLNYIWSKLYILVVVTDENGVPLPGANVIIEDTNTGVSTDFDGNFEITASQGQILAFSYIGYTTQYITAAGQSGLKYIPTA